MNNLNIRHEAFAREYHKNGFNGLQAYKSTYGGSDKACVASSARLLTKVNIKNYLKELGEKANKTYGIDMQKLVEDLKNIKRIGLTPAIYLDKDGNECKGKPVDLNASLKAVDTLIKIIGGYAPTKTEGTLDVNDVTPPKTIVNIK